MQSQLLHKLARHSAMATSLLAIPVSADAQIVYSDIPDTLVNDGVYYLDLNNDSEFDYRFNRGDFNITYVSVTGMGENSLLGSLTADGAGFDYVYPLNLNPNDPIDVNQPFKIDHRGLLAGATGGESFFMGETNAYLGVRFMIDGNRHYGWIRLDVSEDAEWFRIKDFAYHATPETGILAGQISVGTTCSDNFEPNNFPQSATPVSSGNTYNGLIHTGTDRDFYSINITSGEPHLKVKLTDLPKNYNIRLLNSNGLKIGQSVNVKKEDEEIINNNLNPGTYYILVYPKDQSKFDVDDCYALQVETSNSPFKFLFTDVVPVISKFSVFPNPVAATAAIQFSLNKQSTIEIDLVDIQGRKIKTLLEGNFAAGDHQLPFEKGTLGAGVYLVRLKSSNELITQKLIVE